MDTSGDTDAKPSPSPSPSSSSRYVKTVVLRDWWLVRSQTEFEGKTLAVSGFPDEEVAVRVFISTPIVKRHSAVMLETADGAYVILNGFINRPFTEKCGFASKVFKFFLFGFPLNWEEYAGRKCGDDECPYPVSIPRKKSVNGYAATVCATKTPENMHVEESVDIGMAAPAMKKSKSASNSTKNKVGDTAGAEDTKKKPKTSENVLTGDSIDVVKAVSAKGSKSRINSAKSKVGATSGVKDTKTKLKTSENVPARDANDAVKASPTAKKSKGVGNPAKSNLGVTSGVNVVKTKLIFDTAENPTMLEGLKSPSVAPSDISSLKKSRSGRLLLHPLEFWRNEKAVYDSSRKITGIVCGTPDSA